MEIDCLRTVIIMDYGKKELNNEEDVSIKIRANGSCSYRCPDFLRLYALGFGALRVIGFNAPQVPLRVKLYSRCSRLDRFSSGMYFCFN